jgi:hypothetical protein
MDSELVIDKRIDTQEETLSAIANVFINLGKFLKLRNVSNLNKESEKLFSVLCQKSQNKLNSTQRKCFVLVSVYMVLKKNGINIRINEFLVHVGIEKKKFYDYYKKAVVLYPDYQKRNKKLIVLQKITDLKEQFKFSNEFTLVSERILQISWPYIQNGKEEVNIGIITIFSLIRMEIHTVNFNEITKFLGISMGNLNNRVKKLFIDTLGINEFNTLKGSSHVIKSAINNNEAQSL